MYLKVGIKTYGPYVTLQDLSFDLCNAIEYNINPNLYKYKSGFTLIKLKENPEIWELCEVRC